MSARRVVALAVFALRTNGRMGITRAGVLVGVAVVMLGPGISLASGRGWGFDTELAFYGVLLAMMLGLRSGLGEQRAGDLDLFLVHNLVSRAEHAAGMLLGLVLTWAILCVAALAALLLASGGDPGTAAWYTAAWGLRAGVLLGFVPLTERVTALRAPFVLPALGYLLLLLALSVLIGEQRATEVLVVARRGEPATLARLAAHAVAVTAGASALFLAGARVGERGRARRRGGGRSVHGSPDLAG